MKIFQKFNKKIGAWVKMTKMSNGLYKILDVKQTNPSVAFKNIPKL